MKYEKLFSPITIKGMTLKNRIIGLPFVSGLATEEGWITEDNEARYKREAMGGLAARTIEPGVIQPSKSSHNIRFSDDRFIPGVKELVGIMREQDSDLRIGMQLVHFLKVSRKGWVQKLTDLTLEDIEYMVQYYVDAAKRALAVGLDYIEIHVGHTTTLASFLSLVNHRTDEYGGSFENRLRAPTRVYQAIRDTVGESFPIGIRINGEDFIRGGNTLLQSRPIAKRFAELGVDYISVSAGERIEDAPPPPPGYPPDPARGYSGSRMSPPWNYPDGPNVFLAEGVRKYLRDAGFDVPIVTAGKIRTPRLAEQILEQGKADIIGLARPILCDPDWAIKAREGRDKDIVRCAACNYCLDADARLEHVYCSRWPEGIVSAAPIPWLPKDARPAALPRAAAVS